MTISSLQLAIDHEPPDTVDRMSACDQPFASLRVVENYSERRNRYSKITWIA
jgi:hypothetical protein